MFILRKISCPVESMMLELTDKKSNAFKFDVSPIVKESLRILIIKDARERSKSLVPHLEELISSFPYL